MELIKLIYTVKGYEKKKTFITYEGLYEFIDKMEITLTDYKIIGVICERI